MHATLQRILTDGPVVTDGAWGTELQSRGLPMGVCGERWNLEQPQRVAEVAQAYVDAGSRIILTNTFNGNRITLARHNLADQVVEINRVGTRISKEAAGERALVFGGLGPTGVVLMMGEVSGEEVQAAFAEQAQAMAEAGADGIVIETMSDPAELRLAVKAAKATGLPVVACMVFDSGPKHDRTMMGTTPEQAAEVMIEEGADVIGSNCGRGIEGFVEICQRLREAAEGRPVWIKANRGLPELRGGNPVYTQSAEEFAAEVPLVLAAGASFVGGCCGTTPEFIAAARKVVDQA